MKLLNFFIVILIIFSFNSVKGNEIEMQSKITKNLRCLICQGQSVFDSDSDFAISLKLVVKNKIDEGFTEDQIYKFLTKKYGEWILYDPQFNKNTYILWFLPLLIFLFGGAIIFKKLNLLFVILFFATSLIAAEETKKNGNQLNFFTGNFDFSDDKQSAYLIGFQHQDENLNRDTFLGNVSPITGGFMTENSAAYLYTGIEWNMDMGENMIFTPSFAPGLYHEGDGKDLGHVLEFKSELQLSYSASENSSFGISYNHVSNASLGDKNPGANSYMFNFIKNF